MRLPEIKQFNAMQNVQAGEMGRQQGMMDARTNALQDVGQLRQDGVTPYQQAQFLMPYAPKVAQGMIDNQNNQQKLLMEHRKLQQGDRRLSQGMYTSDMKNFLAGGGSLDDVEGYRRYQEQAANLRRPTTTIINPGQKGQTAMETKIGNAAGEAYVDMLNTGTKAASTEARLRGIVQVAKELGPDNFGTVAKGTMAVRGLMQGLGMLSPEQNKTLSNQQIVDMFNTQFTMDYVSQTKGAISNAEMELFQRAAPGLGNTYDAFLFKVDVAVRAAQRQQEAAKIYQEAVRTFGRTPDGHEQAMAVVDDWRNSTPFFNDDERTRLAAAERAAEAGPVNRSGKGDAQGVYQRILNRG